LKQPLSGHLLSGAMRPDEGLIGQRFDEFGIGGKHRPMESRFGLGNFLLGFLVRARNSSRLPSHDLPPAVALQKRAGVKEFCDLSLAAALSGGNQSECDDRGVAVLLNAYIFGGVSSRRVSGLTSGRRPRVAHDVGLADSSAR